MGDSLSGYVCNITRSNARFPNFVVAPLLFEGDFHSKEFSVIWVLQGQWSLTEPDAAGVESALVPGHGVLIAGYTAQLQDALGARAAEPRAAHVHQRKVDVRAAGRDVVAARHQPRAETLRILYHLAGKT